MASVLAASSSSVPADGPSGGPGGEGAAPVEKSETGFLSRLLRGDLVASALDHDMVIGDAARTAPGRTAAVEARRVAERAAASLKESFERRQREAVSIPTWTGRNGGAGIPGKRPSFGGSLNPALVRSAIGGAPRPLDAASRGGAAGAAASGAFFGHAGPAPASAPLGSAALLQRIRERKDAAQGLVGPDAEAIRLLQRLCAYFRAQPGGKCTSEQLVNAFKGNEVDARLFKQLLKEAASKDARGVWKLKADYEGIARG
jgi:DNA excision repair protein ERCC-6